MKFPVLIAALSMSLSSTAFAATDTIRPGSEGGGGRIGKVCVSDYLSQPEQADCVSKMQAAQTSAERAEIRDLMRQVIKARQKDAEIRRDNLNPGGPQRR